MFLNRAAELAALDGLADGPGGLAVVWGRRRIGKTRLLLEWCSRAGGVYTTADQSGADADQLSPLIDCCAARSKARLEIDSIHPHFFSISFFFLFFYHIGT